MDAEKTAQQFRDDFSNLSNEIGKVIVGMPDIVDMTLTCLFAGGHCLLEGVPGLGKTLLIKTLSEAMHLAFSRIQFTPDLMPADIIGTNIIVDTESGGREIRFRHGPIFANIILADEINRATPKTQSALLEAMQEHTVSVGKTTHRLDEPFFVLATQNPIEMEGTYPLPEAQLDRFFFKLLLDYPDHSGLVEILNRTTRRGTAKVERIMDAEKIIGYQGFVRDVAISPKVAEYVARLITATHPSAESASETVKKYVRFGSSPRGAQAIILAAKVTALRDARYNVGFEDIQNAALPALRHRILINYEGEADGVTSEKIIENVLSGIDKFAKAG